MICLQCLPKRFSAIAKAAKVQTLIVSLVACSTVCLVGTPAAVLAVCSLGHSAAALRRQAAATSSRSFWVLCLAVFEPQAATYFRIVCMSRENTGRNLSLDQATSTTRIRHAL